MSKFLIWFCIFAETLLLIQTDDICFAPFTEFLKCVINDAENKMQSYEQEATPQMQDKLKLCFRQSNCEEPDFNKANVDYFLAEPWSSRIKTVLELLESTDPRVQKCMIEYFKGIAQRKIQECVRTYGTADVKNFEMPPIPETKNLDITKLKAVTLNRMMVYRQLLQCTRTTSSDGTLQETVDCVKTARAGQGETLCRGRQNCRVAKVRDLVCLDRLDKVMNGACDCVKAEHEQSKNGMGHLDNWRELKDTLMNGGLEKQYKTCHLQNNLPYPQDKVNAAKKAIQDSVKDVLLKGGLPSEVRDALSTAGGALKEIIDEWKKMFCSDCIGSKILSTGTDEAKKLRSIVARQDETLQNPNQNAPRSNNLLDKLRNLFGQSNDQQAG